MSSVDPIALPDGRKVWLVSRYDEARQVLTDPRLSNDTRKMGDQAPLAALPESVQAAVASDMLNCDPPAHTRLRRLVAPTFTVRRIAEHRPRIERIAHELLDACGAEADLVEDFAGPLATRVLGELIGMDPEDAPDVRRWSDMFVMELLTLSEEVMAATASLSEYAADLVRRRRDEPRDDMVTRLISLRDSGDRLSDDELSSMVFILMIAGQTATAQLLAKGLHLLLTNPDQLTALREKPDLVPSAVQETLRIDPSLQMSAFRMATEPVEVDGITIPRGDIVLCSLLAANHDAERFPEPERFDVRRRDNQHLAFSHGIHRCLGANLAELQAQVGIAVFAERFPHALLRAEDVSWRQTPLVNVLTTLPVELS
ncbi:cytochrome P450 [Lentzea tibetensis]|uniref:Cytochrome P450 n=1 Tax=Lentzea tibetensis TaxID=2591470 RepID=A0A563ETD5_9PSEU|nr:cytochrome P450 [Lentzea tibetensis]TWP50852.1 cytochrome P450 [Lentzea tibetensis]